MKEYRSPHAYRKESGRKASPSSQIPDHILRVMQNELELAEHIRWQGKPTRLKVIVLASFGIWLFAIPWTAFSVFWMFGAAGFQMPDFSSPEGYFPLFGVPFLLIGLGMLSTPWWVKKKINATYYFVTDRAAYILNGARGVTIKRFDASKLSDLRKTVSPDGSGRIIFYTENSLENEKEVGFLGLNDVNEVESFLKEIAR